MSAADLLDDLTRRGFTLAPEGDGIRIRPAAHLTAELRQRVLAHKAELLALLRPSLPAFVSPADLPGHWHLAWDERAAIMEHDGGLPRERAEALALADVLCRMRPAGDTCIKPK